MRICLYTETALPKIGGHEMAVDALAREFLALGHEPVVLAPHPRRPLLADDGSLPYPVVRHPRFFSTHWFVSWYRWYLQRLFARQSFDVLHCIGLYPPGYLAALSRHRLNVPVLITSQGGDVYEKNVRLAKLIGANREQILHRIPHIAALMVDSIDAAIVGADVIVLGNGDPDFRAVPGRLGSGQFLVDLVRVNGEIGSGGAYDGICW